jgi:hypothetical protein
LRHLDPKDPLPDGYDRGLYNNRPPRAKAEPIGDVLARFDPRIGALKMIESVILPNQLHRVKFKQFGRIPDQEPILAGHAPQDGRYVFCTTWMDERGTGHAYLAWKENL